jgi:hypothetical protein
MQGRRSGSIGTGMDRSGERVGRIERRLDPAAS